MIDTQETTVELTGGVETLEYAVLVIQFWIYNNSENILYASVSDSECTNDESVINIPATGGGHEGEGVVAIPAGSYGVVGNRDGSSKLYLKGSGSVTIDAFDEAHISKEVIDLGKRCAADDIWIPDWQIIKSSEATRNIHCSHGIIVRFDRAYKYYVIRNNGPFAIYATGKEELCDSIIGMGWVNVDRYKDGVFKIPSGTSVIIPGGTHNVFLYGAGGYTILGQDDKINSYSEKCFVDYNVRKITMGEEKTFYITLYNKQSVFAELTPFVPEEGDKIVFSVWDNWFCHEEFFEKEYTLADFVNGQLPVAFSKADTSHFSVGDYYTKFELFRNGEKVRTLEEYKLRSFRPERDENTPATPITNPNNG